MNVKPNMNYLPLFFFPFFISISFNRFIVYISFAQILFCFRVTLQSYFPLIDFLHCVLSPQTYSFPWHIWFLLNCQSIFSLVWTKIYIQVLQRPTRIRHSVMIERFLHTSWVFDFVYDNFLFTLKITRIRIGLCTTWIDLWTLQLDLHVFSPLPQDQKQL